MKAYQIGANLSSEFHAVLSPDLKITYLNPSFQDFLGWYSENNPVPNLREVVYPEDQALLIEVLQNLQAEESFRGLKVRFQSKTQEVNSLRLNIHKDAENAFFMVGQLRVTKVDSTARFRRFFDLSLLDLVVIIEQNLDMSYINRGTTQLLGYTWEEVNKSSLMDYMHPEEQGMVLEMCQEMMREETKAFRFINRVKHKSGQYFWVEWSMLYAKGHFYGVGNNVSEKENQRRQIQNLLQETVALNQQLEEQNKTLIAQKKQLSEALEDLELRNIELDQFVYRVSHDIRAPLSSVLGLLNLINTTEVPYEDYGQYMELMEYSMLSLDRFTANLMKYLRIERENFQLEEVNVAQLVEDCCEELEFMKNYDDLNISIEADQMPLFISEPIRLKILFGNVLSNAIKFLNPQNAPSYLQIRLQKTEYNRICVEFRDNGIGIADGEVEKIFSMFYRGTELSKGSGLGLYIVQQIMRQFKGEIEVKSQLDKGTSFLFYFPQ